MLLKERIIFIPMIVYTDWIQPVLGPHEWFYGDEIALQFYNVSEEGVNCRVMGLEESDIALVIKQFDVLIQNAMALDELFNFNLHTTNPND